MPNTERIRPEDFREVTGGDPGSPGRGSRIFKRVALYGGAAGLAFWSVLEAGLHASPHDDLWWYLAAGRHMTRYREIVKVDPFTHTVTGQHWVNPEWLTEVLFYSVYDTLGENWLTVLRIGLIFLIFAVSLRFCLLRSRSWHISLLCVAGVAWVCRPFLDTRAQLFTFIYASAVLLILHGYRRENGKLLLLIPVIMVVWTQQHFGYYFGLLLLLGNLVAESGKRLLHLPADPLTWNQIRTLAAVTALSAVAILINPWTFEAYTEPLNMLKIGVASNPWMKIVEWTPPGFFASEPFNPPQFWVLLLLLAGVCLPIALVAWRSFDMNDVGLAAVLAVVFALQHRRFIPLFAILTLPLLGYASSFWMDRWAGTSGQRRRQVTLTVALASWLLLVILVPVRVHALAREYAGRGLFRTNVDAEHFPERAVKFLSEIRIPGRMYNVYSWGGFLAHFLPESPTFIDGRSILYDEQFYLSYKATRRARKGWKEFLDRHGVTFAIISKHKDADLFQAMIGDRDWTWVFSDEKSAILLRESPANRELLKRFDAQELPLPDTGDTYFLYGMRAVEKRDYALAAEGFATACERSPDRDLYRSSLIRALGSAGRLEEARREADRALADFPDSDRIVRESALLDSLLHRIE